MVVVVGVIGLAGWNFARNSRTGDTDHSTGENQTFSKGQAEWPMLWGPPGQNCQEKESVKYTAENIMVNIPVKAGQQIGFAWSFELLGMVTVDLTHTNKGYLNPVSYKAENWRIHSVPPFDYFDESLKSQLHAKNPRKTEPLGGKIDFDIEDKIVGNWFEEGSGGFRDESKPPQQCGNFPCPYWEGHLALVYDFIDPKQLRVSVGFKPGLAKGTPYGVKGNGPDFKDIGVVKYELVGLKNVSREKGYISETEIVTESDDSQVFGIMLVQLLEKGKLRMEIFPDKSKDQASAFTSKAKVYIR